VGIGYGKIDGTAAVTSPSAIAATSDLEDLALGASYNFGSSLNGGYNSLKWKPASGATSGRWTASTWALPSPWARQLPRQVRQRQVQR
jgi:hypothetical protein